MTVRKNSLLFLPDSDFDDGDEYHETDVDALNAQVDALLQDTMTPLRTTVLTRNGQRIGPALMSDHEAKNCLSEYENAGNKRLLRELLDWAGREPQSEAEQNALAETRQRAEALLSN